MDKIFCKIFGCELEQYGPACHRCGTWLYNYGFVDREMSWMAPWYKFVWWVRCNRDWFFRRCDVCKKRMFFTKNECCSKECYDLWLPF